MKPEDIIALAGTAMAAVLLVVSFTRVRAWRKIVTTFMSPACPGRISPTCTCDGSCGATAGPSCRCAVCPTWWSGGIPRSQAPSRLTGRPFNFTPASPARSASRPGQAGVPGFDGRASADYSLALGSVRGVRSWNLPVSMQLFRALAEELAPAPELLLASDCRMQPWLQGVKSMPWRPGINEARCQHYADHEPPVEFDEKRGTKCGCGFWAYWKLNPQVLSWGRGSDNLTILGVIEGTGRALIGTEGFRCQKARIIALALGFVIEPALATPLAPGGSQECADAWMGILMDVLGTLYPEARVFATVAGMLASVPPGEVTS